MRKHIVFFLVTNCNNKYRFRTFSRSRKQAHQECENSVAGLCLLNLLSGKNLLALQNITL